MLPDGRKMPDSTVLIFEITYPNSSKVYHHALLKTNGHWHMTGRSGPQDAGWGAILNWLTRDNRILRAVHQVTQVKRIAGDYTWTFEVEEEEEEEELYSEAELVPSMDAAELADYNGE